MQSCDFAEYREDRDKEVGGNTVRLELALISHVFSTARKEWNIPVDNPISGIRMPKLPEGRTRRLEGDEEQRLLKACNSVSDDGLLAAAVTLAIETGMRIGELASVQWRQVDFVGRTIQLELTLNGNKRTVPLSKKASGILENLRRGAGARVFAGFASAEHLSRRFGEMRDAAGIVDLHFHDLRHEAASRLAPHMKVHTLAKVLGWKTLQMAMRYYNPKDSELVKAVDRASQKKSAGTRKKKVVESVEATIKE